MKVTLENLTKRCLNKIFFYNSNFSFKYAKDVEKSILMHIYLLSHYPFIGRIIPEISDKRFREIIYTKNKHSGYRIMYYISNLSSTIYILYIVNSKENFNQILKQNNYFQKYYDL